MASYVNNIPAWALSWILLAYTMYDTARVNTTFFMERFMLAFDTLLTPVVYVFFEGYSIPIAYQMTQTYPTGSAKALMLYNSELYTFMPCDNDRSIQSIMQETKAKLPYLSLEIVNMDDRVHYDLTEFIESIRFIDVEGFSTPSLFSVVMAWSLSSRILPDLKAFTLRSIDISGETNEYSFDDAAVMEPIRSEREKDKGA